MSNKTEATTFNVLMVLSKPTTTVYAPGQKITYEGIKILLDGKDVTDKVTYSVPEGRPWDAADKAIEVEVSYEMEDGNKATTKFKLKRKNRFVKPIAAIAVLGIVAGCAYGIWQINQPEPETGSRFIMQGSMSDDEAREMLDKQVEESRITVSLAPTMELDGDALRVNFVIVEPNNGLSERLEVEQDGIVVYRSGVLEPGYKLERGTSQGAHPGPATATVYAVTPEGSDTGNPISVEVEIVNVGNNASEDALENEQIGGADND